jgi:CubicO group peptidase (beta-lactamase class C family)
MKAQQAPGISVAIFRGGGALVSLARGEANLEKHTPATPETLYRIASVSKPLTAVAVLQLAAAGKLDLDAPAQRYCPVFTRHPEVTARMLLGHRSGIHHYKDDETAFNTWHFKSLTDAVKNFASDPLEFKAGEKFLYSSYGYTLLGCEIEGASGQRYADYVREHILAPAKMTHTVVDDSLAPEAAKAKFYSLTDGHLAPARKLDSSDRLPGGGWLSTPTDMVKFASSVEGLLGPEWTRTLWTETTRRGENEHYALGWGISELNGHPVAQHSGGQSGTSTALVYLPNEDIAVAVFINRDGADAMKVAHEIVEEMVEKE